VNPGDIIAGDRNGVVVLRPDEAENVMARAMEKRLRQEAVIKKMRETGEVMPRIPKKMENR
jgi:regulator of RNase E activity RraA